MKTPAELRQHVLDIGKAFNISVREQSDLPMRDAAMHSEYHPTTRRFIRFVIVVRTVTDEETYAVAMHELGHAIHPGGLLRTFVPGEKRNPNLSLDEEISAWEWAKKQALIWTPSMQSVMDYGLSTYTQPPVRVIMDINPRRVPSVSPEAIVAKRQRSGETLDSFLRRREKKR